MKNAVLVSLFLAGSALAMPSAIQTPNALSRAIRSENETVGNSACNGPSSSQDKPATDVNNVDVCAEDTLKFLQNSRECKEIPCADPKETWNALRRMTACVISKEPNLPRDENCETKATDSTVNCVQENPPSNSSTYRFDPPGKQVAIDENLRVTRQCSQQAIAGYKQCAAAGKKL
ncbi:hypothetical protein MGU_10038 [Metarhizium guizhouense ARSEF 977]|uniref:Secreted protein n=1 Tax=Metarhizium guizhouense (strain ARSEF 977) TaxID=1276136 RepID=A0A0B4GYQ2_METGA|nr:hypothetical protein MGU_10038 [Metarhizium guizhouense ARSEF 977]